MEPTAPSLLNMLVPVPVVFSPAEGWWGGEGGVSWVGGDLGWGLGLFGCLFGGWGLGWGEGKETHDLVNRLVDARGEFLVFHGAVGALFHCFG